MPGDWDRHLFSLPFFTKAELRKLDKNEKSIEMFIYRQTTSGKIVRLRNGIYTTAKFIDSIKGKSLYTEYLEALANLLVPGSYLSCEYVLDQHGLLSEGVSAITSVTVGKGCVIKNALGTFVYRSIKPSLYTNFGTAKHGDFIIKKATKIKALCDYLYLKKRDLHTLNRRVVDELRVNIFLLKPNELKRVGDMIDSLKSRKLTRVYKYMKEIYADGRS